MGADAVAKPESSGQFGRHAARLAPLALAVALLLGWLASHAAVLFADGLRYVAQARSYDAGSAAVAARNSVDHPAYPLAIAAVHRLLGGSTPESWQAAAQTASCLAALLLIVPLYLVARELVGNRAAAPACWLTFASPVTGHVFADALSESTFLLFWTWGLWGALRFLRSGRFGWLALVVAGAGLAYLTRPEGLLLPAALLATLALCPRWTVAWLGGRRGLLGLALAGLGIGLVVGPYVAMKGGLGTKPSIARLLGTAPKSAPDAVERQRPLDPGQSAAKTLSLAAKAVFKAVMEAVTWPLVVLALTGLVFTRGRDSARHWRLLGVIGAASTLALMRLHATGGYCTPRHALILSLPAFALAALGIDTLIDRLAAPGAGSWRRFARPAGWAVVALGLAIAQGKDVVSRLNPAFEGYHQAGTWLADHTDPSTRVIDVTGWSQFYGARQGYTFADLVAAPGDPAARWVVAREAHLRGPWPYCHQLRDLVQGRAPVADFRGSDGTHPTRVYVFDRHAAPEPRMAGGRDALSR